MDLKDIKALIDLMKKNDLSVFKMENGDFKITLKKNTDFQPVISTVGTPATASAATLIPTVAATTNSTTTTDGSASAAIAGSKEITSPMVGTFYRAPSPEAAAFVGIGDRVTEDTVVCIIEAMKVMNEIKAEVSGVITEVLAENGKPVQFGQPLFKIK
ncbi:MAG TPA: acetyl-CoA carboxylase biotin carboxyl carrier protein [Chthoniobacterales bacterium]